MALPGVYCQADYRDGRLPLFRQFPTFFIMSENRKKHRLGGQAPPPVDWLNEIPGALPVPLAVTRVSDRKLLYGNSHLGALLGERAEDVTGKDFGFFYTDPDTYEKILAALRDGDVCEMEIGARRRDGTGLTLLASFTRVSYRGEPDCLLAVFSDVTARRSSEKMATLGTLAAGIAHELNNPAAATHRAAAQLGEAFAQLQDGYLRLASMTFTPAGRDALKKLEEDARTHASQPVDLDALARSDRETAVEDWLEEHGIADGGDIAPSLAAQGLQASSLSGLAGVFQGDTLGAVLGWIASAYLVYTLVFLIRQGSGRISEIVRALKSYSFPGQEQVQPVNLHEGIDNTLVILRSKLRDGVTVHRRYAEDLPPVLAFGSELNQVWMNLLDNAIDAMNGHGEITIRTRAEAGWAIVEIEDNGPGIPSAAQSRIFDPFYTTKEPGQGTGLGLSTSYGIVTQKHGGEIRVESHPGMTRFTVRLPIGQPIATDNPRRTGV